MEQAMKEQLAPSSASPAKSTTSHLVVGEEYKITGGKFKKYKTCVLEKVLPTYSDVKVVESAGDISVDKSVKVKNIYLLRCNPPAIEMPDENDLEVVEQLPDGWEEEETIEEPFTEGSEDDMIESDDTCMSCRIKELERQLAEERKFSNTLIAKLAGLNK